MIVAVAEGARPELRDPEDMRSFKIVAGPGLESEAALRAALAGVAELISGREAWVSQGWVRSASGRDAADEWHRGFEAMLAYATKKGWVREEDGAIRAHIEAES